MLDHDEGHAVIGGQPVDEFPGGVQAARGGAHPTTGKSPGAWRLVEKLADIRALRGGARRQPNTTFWNYDSSSYRNGAVRSHSTYLEGRGREGVPRE